MSRGAFHPSPTAAEKLVIENHVGASPDDHTGTGVCQPPELVDQGRDEISHKHDYSHAEDEAECEQYGASVAGPGNTKDVIDAHHEIGNQDGDDRVLHTYRDLDAFMSLFFGLEHLETDPQQE